MVDLLITLIGVGPVVLALLAAVAPPKADWIRPALLPAVMLQLAIALALSARHFLFGTLAGGAVPTRALSSEEINAMTAATSGMGLPSTLALMASITAAAAAVAFFRHKGPKQATPWACLMIGAFLADRAHASVVQTVASQPTDGGVDLVALGLATHQASSPWILPSLICFLLAFAAFAWSGWWSRARWTEGMLPGLAIALIGIPVAATSAAYNAGMKPAALLNNLAYEQPQEAIGDSYAFLSASVFLVGATVLAAALGLARMLVARRQRVRSTRAMLRGLAWIPLSVCLLACMQLAQAMYITVSAPGVLLFAEENADPNGLASSLFANVDVALATYLPIAAYAAVFSLALMLAAGPLRASRRPQESAKPSATA